MDRVIKNAKSDAVQKYRNEILRVLWFCWPSATPTNHRVLLARLIIVLFFFGARSGRDIAPVQHNEAINRELGTKAHDT